MFRELKNEAKILLVLKTRSPLSIRIGEQKSINPMLPDMQCVKSRYQGKDTVIIPGSSLKGVIRSRYEKLVGLFGVTCCNPFDKNSSCRRKKGTTPEPRGKAIYQRMCPACKLFGSVAIASRIYIADAYPVGEIVMGERTGVGINRITGGAQPGAIYDFEVVEEGSFQVNITLKNYELYQLILLLYVLKDLDEGYVVLGGATTRGNGRMEVRDIRIQFHEYRKAVAGLKDAMGSQEIIFSEKYHFQYEWKQPFYGEAELENITLDEILEECASIDIECEINRIGEGMRF